MFLKLLLLLLLVLKLATCFWDAATTTLAYIDYDKTPRQSFFRWQWTYTELLTFWFTQWDWQLIKDNRRLRCIAGISIDLVPLGTAVLLNHRTLITSANYIEPYLHRQKDLRIWALGRQGEHTTPYRYRVWRVRRLIPRSNNPEHWHGPTGDHVPRHDVAIIHSYDQMYLHSVYTARFNYPHKAILCDKRKIIDGDRGKIWFAGSGHSSLKDIRENYKIKWSNLTRSHIVDCSKYLPKWWGKFICMINWYGLAGIENGAGLFVSTGDDDILVGIGCFEIRYNEDRIFVFTDLRYYIDWINIYANITPGDYYEYAYPKWSVTTGLAFHSQGNVPYIPKWQIRYDMYPLGKK